MTKEKLTVPITNCINKCISSSNFSDELKISDITSVYKKQDVSDKTNYRQIGLLPIISKIFEKILYSRLETVANKMFPPKLSGFTKGHSSQKAPLNLLKTGKYV